MRHYCMRCGKPCDCWAFDQTHGDVCDGCSDCLDYPEGSPDEEITIAPEKNDGEVTWGGYPLTWGDEG